LKYWVETRNFNPVSVPVTLETGEIVEQRFTVNIGGEYWVDLKTSSYPWSDEIAIEEWRRIDSPVEIRDASGKKAPTYSWDGTLTGNAPCIANLL
jgi:hypothetical protein